MEELLGVGAELGPVDRPVVVGVNLVEPGLEWVWRRGGGPDMALPRG